MAAGLLTHPWLVADDNGRVAGYAYAGRHSGRAAYDWSAEVTVYLHPDYHRQGLGKRLYRTLFDILQRQGYHALFALIAMPNDASIALHRSLGMTEVGIYREVGLKFGRWHDVVSMGMTLPLHGVPASAPVPFEKYAESDLRA
jgi:phosphinothricin acetyltransferase